MLQREVINKADKEIQWILCNSYKDGDWITQSVLHISRTLQAQLAWGDESEQNNKEYSSTFRDDLWTEGDQQ